MGNRQVFIFIKYVHDPANANTKGNAVRTKKKPPISLNLKALYDT